MASCASNTPKTRKSTASKASISSVRQSLCEDKRSKLEEEEEEERLAVIMIKVAVYHLKILHVSLLQGSVSSTVAMT